MTRPVPFRWARSPWPAVVLHLVFLLPPASGGEPEAVAGVAPDASPILAAYDFEVPSPSGPDTFWVRQQSGGAVDLTTAFRFGGERSLRLREVPGNGDFVEFLAYFPPRNEGVVIVQFYVLFADPGERFNFGLAGPEWFLRPVRDGHAVWIQTEGAALRHRSEKGWRRLAPVRTFTWYLVDLLLDVDRGTYDLALWEEGLGEPVADLRDVPAFHGSERSVVRFASFIGDLEDEGAFDVFVDDLRIASDPGARLAPFVAPGRRQLFVDLLHPRSEEAQGRAENRSDESWRWLLARRGEPLPAEEIGPAERRAADAVRAGELELAEALFELLRSSGDRDAGVRALLGQADVHHLRGEVGLERELREAIYGRLAAAD